MGRPEEDIANLDEEHSREDLTQGFSATCNPGPLREPRSSNPHMSHLPSSHDQPRCYYAAEMHLSSSDATLNEKSPLGNQSKEGRQGNGKETE